MSPPLKSAQYVENPDAQTPDHRRRAEHPFQHRTGIRRSAGAGTLHESARDGLQLAAQESPDVTLLDMRLGDRSGLEVFRELRAIDRRNLIIFITGFGTADTAIEAMKLGAYDYLVKPLDATQLQQVVGQALVISRLMHVPTIVEGTEELDRLADRLVGSGALMRTVCKQIGRVAPQDVNVLILGESGTGKELVAQLSTTTVIAAKRRSWRSTARRFRIPCWKASCLATSAGASPVPNGVGSANLNSATAARCFSTRSAT